MDMVWITSVMRMNITVCLKEIMQWTCGITTHILIHKCSSNICTYIIHIKYSVCNYKWLGVSTKWRAFYNSNIFSGPNAVFQQRWYNYYLIHDYNKLDSAKQMNSTGLSVTICFISSWPWPVYQHILIIYYKCNQYDSSMLGGHQFAPQEI